MLFAMSEPSRRRSPFVICTTINLIIGVGIVALLHFQFQIDWFISYLITINLLTFVNYAYDKMAAMMNIFRIPGYELHLLTFIGGTPAALLAQQLLRHKTIKKSFRIVYMNSISTS